MATIPWEYVIRAIPDSVAAYAAYVAASVAKRQLSMQRETIAETRAVKEAAAKTHELITEVGKSINGVSHALNEEIRNSSFAEGVKSQQDVVAIHDAAFADGQSASEAVQLGKDEAYNRGLAMPTPEGDKK